MDMDGNKKRVYQRQIGDTVYIIEALQSETAKETAFSKVKRLIINNANSDEKLSNITQKSFEIDSTSSR